MPTAELPELEIREYRAGDEVAILDTFNRVFAETVPGFVPRSLEEWRWQYLDNPSGWRIWLALTPDGHVVSQYAGVGQRALLEGAPAQISQAVDSMTDPAFRRGLKKPGFFVLTGYPYAANYGGPPPDGDTIMWGLPVPPAWRIGKTYLKYELVRTQLKLTAPSVQLGNVSSGGTQIEELERFPDEDEVAELFARCAEGYGLIAVRDRAQLEWRYTNNPIHDYRLVAARREGRLCGLLVYRVGDFDREEGEALVCEWLVPRDEAAAATDLRHWLRERAVADGAERVTAIFPETAHEWIDFQVAGLRVRRTNYFLVGRNYVRKYTMQWLYRHWWYCLGDTDLC